MEMREKGTAVLAGYGAAGSRGANGSIGSGAPVSKETKAGIYDQISPSSSATTTTTKDNNPPHQTRREPLLLIDASAYIYRSYYAMPPLHASDGTPVGALTGFCNLLTKLLLPRLLRGDRPRAVLVYDSRTGSDFRKAQYADYKANRGPCPEDLVPQFELVKRAGVAFGMVGVDAEGYEADDVIATLTKWSLEEGVDVDVLSGDKDLMQLISAPGVEPTVHMVEPQHMARVTHDDVVEKWGVSAALLGDVLALAGDSADNIPGVPGIGPKIAATLINDYGTLTNLIENAESVKQKKRRENLIEHADKALLSRKLVTLEDSLTANDMTLPPSFRGVADFRMEGFDSQRLLDFYEGMELVEIRRRLLQRLGGSGDSGRQQQQPMATSMSTLTFFKSPPKPEDYEGVPF